MKSLVNRYENLILRYIFFKKYLQFDHDSNFEERVRL